MPPEVKSVKIDRAEFQQTLEKKLADLPPLPAVVSRIMQIVNDPNATAEDMNRLISMDPGLTSKVLRIVNSAYYGFPKRVSTITQAVLILGFSTIRNLVMGVSAFGLLSRKSMPYGLNRDRFWEHSVAVAVSGSVIAKRRLPKNRNAADDAFIGGLLHDLGALFLDSYFPLQYAVALTFASHEKKSARESELAVLSLEHGMVGRKIADHWNFPGHIASMIGEHHEPMTAGDHCEVVSVIHAADWLAWEVDFAPSEHSAPPELHPEVESWLGFDPQAWEEIKAESLKQFEGCASMLQVAKEG